MTKTVYVSIGNSDDKLTQREWSQFVLDTAVVLENFAASIHGSWFSGPTQPWQNACWCVEFQTASSLVAARQELGVLADRFRQEAIAWAEVDNTQFIVGVGAKKKAFI